MIFLGHLLAELLAKATLLADTDIQPKKKKNKNKIRKVNLHVNTRAGLLAML